MDLEMALGPLDTRARHGRTCRRPCVGRHRQHAKLGAAPRWMADIPNSENGFSIPRISTAREGTFYDRQGACKGG
jgi:hypothetical protein